MTAKDKGDAAFQLPREEELSQYTRVPPEALGRYLAWPESTLKQEVNAITTILKRFAKAVVDATSQPENANVFLRELDLRSISQDHDWRHIFEAIQNRSDNDSGYNQTVLIKYLQFLSFRKRLFEFVYARKAGLEDTTAFAQTALFPSSEAMRKNQGASTNPWIRLPMGEAVTVGLSRESSVELRLTKYRLLLLGGDQPVVIDENDNHHPIRCGRNIVGRHPESDIVIRTGSAMVSRAHLLLERSESSDELTIMDLSSGGTYIQAGNIKTGFPSV